MKITPQEILNALKTQSLQKPGSSTSSFQSGGQTSYYNNPYSVSKRLTETLPVIGNRIYDMYQDGLFDNPKGKDGKVTQEEIDLQNKNRNKAFTQTGIELGVGLLDTLADSVYSNRVIQSQKEISNRNNEYIPVPTQRYGYQSYLDNPYTYQSGGTIKDMLGYKDLSPFKDANYLDINSNHITMDGVSQHLFVQPDFGKPKVLAPNSGNYYFPNATKVREIPLDKIGRQDGEDLRRNYIIPTFNKPMNYRSDTEDLRRYQVGGVVNEEDNSYGQYNYSAFNDIVEEDTDLPFEISDEGHEDLNNYAEFMSYQNSMRSTIKEKPISNFGSVGVNMQGNENLSAAVRNNSPLNMKYSPFLAKYKALKGRPAKEGDGTFESSFNSIEDGINAAKALWGTPAYSNKTIEEGLKRWSDNTYDKGIYKDLADIKNKRFTELTSTEKDKLIKYQSKWEDGNMYRKIYGK